MSLFQCAKCGCVENTAVCNYWGRFRKGEELEALCSECDPDIGKWHGIFKKRSAKGMILTNDGYLNSKETVESDKAFQWRLDNQGLKIVKEIT